MNTENNNSTSDIKNLKFLNYEKIQPRDYQEAIVKTATQKNTLVVMPTGTGKTLISVLIGANRLEKYPDSKIIITAPSRPLNAQHKKSFEKFTTINPDDIVLLTGKTKPNEREKLYRKAKVIVATPQCLRNDLKNGRLNLRNFSFITFDECISGESNIITPNGPITAKEIANRCFTDENRRFVNPPYEIEILSYDMNRTMTGKITGIWRIPATKKKILEIKLENGKNLILSADHPILTKNGWKKAESIDTKDYVVYFPNKKPLKEVFNDKIILSEGDIEKVCKKYNSSPKRIINELKKLDLLPLSFKNPRFRIIVKLLGHLFGDGYLSTNKLIGFSGNVEDLERINQDFIKLGLKKKRIFSRKTTSKKYRIKGKTNEIILGKHSLWCLFVALGAPIGRKADINFSVPEWLKNAAPIYKKEFLASLCGSVMDKLCPVKNSINFYAPRLCFYKLRSLKKSGIKYAKQLSKLFNELGVKISDVRIRNGNKRADGQETVRFEITVSNSNKNLIRFLKTIGYNYCKERENFGNAVLTFLEIKENKRKDMKKFHHKVARLKNSGLTSYQIAKELKIYKHGVPYFSFIERALSQKYGTAVVMETFHSWYLKNYIISGNCWIKVEDVKEIKYDGWLYDFEVKCGVKDEPHSFYANGILVHNCHRAVKDYPYPYIAKKFMLQSKNPLILGLTASPGGAYERIDEICKNLFIKSVEIRTELDKDVEPYMKPVAREWIYVNFPEEFKKIKMLLEEVVKELVYWLREHQFIKTYRVTKKQLLKLQKKVSSRYMQGSKSYSLIWAMIKSAEAIKIEHAIELLETQGIEFLHDYLKKLNSSKKKTDVRLIKDPRIREAIKLVEELHERKIDHPKLEKVQFIVKDILRKKPDAKIIVFANYRSTVDKIKDLLLANGIKSEILVGQTIKNGKGLTQKQQIEIIKKFADRVFNVLVTSSIGEEGLDIAATDYAIFYEPVPSEIRMIQRRGRVGRQTAGKVIFLITKDTRDEAYYFAALRKEKKMKKILYAMKEKGVKRKETLLDWVK